MDYAIETVLQIKNSPGVRDLPSKAASYFAMALKAEAQGDNEKAESRLDQAIKAKALG